VDYTIIFSSFGFAIHL